MPNSSGSKRMSDKFERFPVLNPGVKQLGPVPATVHAVTSHSIFFKFLLGDKTHYAYGIPGRMYVNGMENLMKYGKSPHLLSAILNLDLKIVVRELSEPRFGYLNLHTSAKRTSEVEEADKLEKKKQNGKAEESGEPLLNVQYYVLLVAPTLYNEKFVSNGLNKQGKFHNEEHSFSKYLDQVHLEELGHTVDGPKEVTWFLVSELGDTGFAPKGTTPTPTMQGVSGTITEIYHPFGGVIELTDPGPLPVTFYRLNTYVEGKLLGLTTRLDKYIKIGDAVTVDLAENSGPDGSLHLHGISGSYVATSVYKGAPPTPKQDLNHAHKLIPDESHKVQIFQLIEDPAGSGAYTSGLAVVQMSALIKSDCASFNMVGEFCKFSNRDLYYCGVNLDGVDLSYLYKPGDTLYVQLAMLPVKEQRAQYAVKVGYSGRYEVAPSALPELSAIHKALAKSFLDFPTLERVLNKQIPPKAQMECAGTAIGRLISLEPAENKETVSKGSIQIEVGPHKGSVIKMNRSKISVLGISLDECDLLYCLLPGELMFCEVGGLSDYPSGQYVSQYCRLISPLDKSSELVSSEDPRSLSQEDRTDFLAWLHQRNLTYPLFQRVKAKTAPFKYFIPFPKDCQLNGRVVSLDPVRKKHGASAGTIVIESGLMNLENPAVGQLGVVDMKGAKVTFHRTNFWVFGRKMAKADLTYLVQPNQRVMLECSEITPMEREHYPNLPINIKYRATIVWIGPTRPRNDKDDPNRNDVSIFDWLSKRGLNIQQFNKLVEGAMPAHNPMELDHRNFFLAAEKGSGGSSDVMADLGSTPEMMPVLRHGPVMAHLLDTAMSCTGPSDPRLYHLLENDQMAQAAHHVSEALKFAIAFYRERSTGLGGGYGPRGPGGVAPKRGFENFRGGPNKRARGGFGFR